MYIENAILQNLSQVISSQGLSLRQMEKKINFSDTYISQVISQKKEPSPEFLSCAVKFIIQERKL